MNIKNIRIHFYKNEVKLLNLVAFIILIINCLDYYNNTLNFYRLFWSCVCIAATVFIDCCTQNVFKELASKKVATIIIGAIIIIAIVIIVGLFI